MDKFFFSAVKVQNYKNLAFILKIVLTLSHGQAAVERGFSVNKAVLDVRSYVIKHPKSTLYGSA